MVRFASIAVLAFLLACTTALGVAANECPNEALPASLNGPAYLGFDGEVVLHGPYMANFSQWNQDVSFTLTTQSAARVYVAPHAIDIDLWLYEMGEDGPTLLAHSSLGIGTEEVLQGTLEPATYRLRFVFIGSSPDPCETMTLAVAITPTERLAARATNVNCPATEAWPHINFHDQGASSTFSLTYDSQRDPNRAAYNVRSQPYPADPSSVRFVHGYSFTIPTPTVGLSGLWTLEAGIGMDFLTAGTLGLLLQRTEDGAPPPVTGPSLTCGHYGKCTMGVMVRTNQEVLSALVNPGNYTLWLYDVVGEKFAQPVVPCDAFALWLSIQPVQEEENFLTCEARPTPTNLNDPGFMTSDGHLAFHGSPLLELEESPHKSSFTLTRTSFFRARVGLHRVDIDLHLGTKGGETIAVSNRFAGEEFIAVHLEAGDYVLTVRFFNPPSLTFCETYNLDVVIVPDDDVADWCSNKPAVTPDLSSLNTDLSSDEHTFALDSAPGHPYRFLTADVGPSIDGGKVWETTFTVEVASTLRARIGLNFVVGDLRLHLDDQEDSFELHLVAEHHSNALQLVTDMQPGQYTLRLEPGPVQTTPVFDGSAFPSCVDYALSLHIAPLDPVETPSCKNYFSVPTSLNGPGFLGTHAWVHISDTFIAPPGRMVTETIVFDVQEESLLRVYTDTHAVDVDFHLLEGGIEVASAVQFNREETILYTLKPKEEYLLRIKYYRWGDDAQSLPAGSCSHWHLELAIAPVAELQQGSTLDCTESVPDASLFPSDPSFLPIDVTHYYVHRQTEHPFSVDVPFTVSEDGSVVMRARVLSPFVRFATVTYVLMDNQVLYTGVSGLDTNALPTLQLQPGNYVLRVAEAQAVPAALRSCVTWSLQVAMADTEDTTDMATASCGSAAPLPLSWDDADALSELSGHQMHWQQEVLAKFSGTRLYRTSFTLMEPSLLRMFIPEHDVIDVDYTLRQGTPDSPGNTIAHSVGVTDESLAVVAEAGPYVLEVRFYGAHGQAAPKPEDCPVFNMEWSVEPVSYAESLQALVSPCPTTAVPLPQTLEPNQAVDVTTSHPLQGAALDHSITFTVTTTTSHLRAHLFYDFPSSGLWASLTSPNSQPIPALQGNNHAWISASLAPGPWTLRVWDPAAVDTQWQPPASLVCAPLQLTALWNTSSDSDPCGAAQPHLPTDLWTTDGGSAAFGGPQSTADGHVQVFGVVRLPDPGSHSYIAFRVLEPSYVRIFATAGEGVRADVDFFLYNSTTPTTANLVSLFIGNDAVESGIVLLEPLPVGDDGIPSPYMVDAYMFSSYVDGAACPVLQWEMAIATHTSVRNHMRCPVPRPSPPLPPPAWHLVAGGNVAYDDTVFVVTRDGVDAQLGPVNSGLYRYSMTMDVGVDYDVSVSLGFNFVENDFRLELHRGSGYDAPLIASGMPSGVGDRSSFINFRNSLVTSLSPGAYRLDVVMMVQQRPTLTDYCHRFAFSMTATPSSTSEDDPTMNGVVPASGTDLDAAAGLQLGLRFSQPIVQPTAASLSSEVADAHAIYLRPQSGGAEVAPSLVSLSPDHYSVIATWHELSPGVTYVLHVDANTFVAADNRHFVLAPGPDHVYTTASCACSGHGACAAGSTVCVCHAGYAGDQCDACDDGYHGVGNACVENVACDAQSCNGHGACTSPNGYPECQCDTGYATLNDEWCSVCAPGYTGYPACEEIPDEAERPASCKAALLPSSLNVPQALGWSGDFHVRDDFYLDLDHMSHSVTFTITEPSLLRVYVEPHVVDVDVWVWSRLPSGQRDKLLSLGISWGDEESTYLQLNDTTSGGYEVRFRYYTWIEEAATLTCPSANIEFAVRPLAKVRAAIAAAALPACQSPASVPMAQYSDQWTLPLSASLPSWSLQPEGDFVVPRQRDGARAFWTRPFHIAEPPRANDGGAQLVLVHAELAYRFVWGDLALVLVTGDATVAECLGKNDPRCVYGDNRLNRNILYAALPAGDYTLVGYEPSPQLGSVAECAPYEFSLDAEYVRATDTVFNCPEASELPYSLDAPGFLDPVLGYAHVYDTYIVDAPRPVFFTLTRDSVFRIAASSQQASFIVLMNATTPDDSSSWSLLEIDLAFRHKVSVYHELPAGSYAFALYTWSFAEFDAPTSDAATIGDVPTCPSLSMELAIVPAGPVDPLYAPECPTSGADLVPTIPQPVPANYEFGIPSQESPFQYPWVTFENEGANAPIFSFPLAVTEASHLRASVASDFVRADLTLRLRNATDGTVLTVGESRYNENLLSVRLSPGAYEVEVVQPLARTGASATACVRFNFGFWLHTNTQLNAGSAASNPLACITSGEDTLHALDTWRFLLVDGRVNYATTNMRVPWPITNDWVVRDFGFTVPTASVFRLYTEPHEVDIDLALYAVDADTGDETLLQASNGFGVEETLLEQLSPGRHYRCEMRFWRPAQEVQECPTFAMQVAVEPVVPLPPACSASGASHWAPAPPTKGMPSTYYHYDSTDAKEKLYYQQSVQGAAMHEYTFEWDRVGNLHVEVSYSFAQADLGLRLASVTDGPDTPTGEPANPWYGQNHLGRNTLNVKSLPPGKYVLRVYEPRQELPSIMGCAPFAWTFTADVDDDLFSGVMNRQALPTSLNTVAFLAFDGATQWRDLFAMWANEDALAAQSTAFTLAEESLLRVSASVPWNLNSASVRSLRLAVRDASASPTSTPLAESMGGAVAVTLPAGDYVLHTEVEVWGDFHVAREANGWRRAAVPRNERGLALVQHWVRNHAVALPAQPSKRATAVGDEPDARVNVQLAIEPTAALHSQAVAGHHTTTTCPRSQIQAPALSPSGSWTYAKDDLTISSSDMRNYPTLQRMAFTVTEDTVVWASVGSHFVVDQLALNLTSSEFADTAVMGFEHANTNEIYELVSAGSYEIVLHQRALLPPTASLEHCATYSFHMSLWPVSSGGGHKGDCAAFNAVVPWDLNAADGGSDAFGGPIATSADGRDSLQLRGDSFLFPEVSGDQGAPSERVAFTLHGPSVVTVFTSAEGLLSMGLEVVLRQADGTEVAVAPVSADSTLSAYLFTWSLDAGHYALVLTYERVQLISSASNCPYFSLHVDIADRATVAGHALCPEVHSSDSQDLPSPTLHLDANGFVHEFLQSTWPAALLPTTGNYTIVVQVTQTSVLDLYLGWESSVSNWGLVVERVTDNGQHVLYHGNRLHHDSQADPRLDAAISLHRTLLRGTYHIVLQHEPWGSFSSHLNLPSTRLYCVPFMWNVLLTPRGATDQVYISGVDPPGRLNLNPADELKVTVFFSHTVYTGDEVPITQDDPSPMRNALYLAPDSTSRAATPVQPSSVTGTASGTEWTLTFARTSLQAGTVYRLQLRANRLYDKTHTGVVMPSSYAFRYATIASCGTHGTFDSSYHCQCDIGYAGVGQCDACDLGFLNVANPGQDPKCQSESTVTCSTPNACGCLMKDGKCEPLGHCVGGKERTIMSLVRKAVPSLLLPPSPRSVTCECGEGYAGPHCRQCADATKQATWPVCGEPVHCSPACQHGTCNQGTGICQCNDHWDGDACTVCASGWSGADCTTAVCTEDCGEHGSCIGGTCVCEGHWGPPACSACVSGWTGDACSKPEGTDSSGPSPTLMLFGGILVGAVLLGVVALVIVWWRRRKRGSGGFGGMGAISLDAMDADFDDDFDLRSGGGRGTGGAGTFSLRLDDDDDDDAF